MAKKNNNNSDKSLIMSKEFFSELTKITIDNIKDFFGYNTLFLFIEKNNLNYELKSSFIVNTKRNKGENYKFRWYWDGEIKTSYIFISKGQTDNDHKDEIESYKSLIRRGINDGTIYAKRI